MSGKAVSMACYIVLCNIFACSRTTPFPTVRQILLQTSGHDSIFHVITPEADRAHDVRGSGGISHLSEKNA